MGGDGNYQPPFDLCRRSPKLERSLLRTAVMTCDKNIDFWPESNMHARGRAHDSTPSIGSSPESLVQRGVSTYLT